MTNKFKQDKGVAGLTVLLSVIVMLFVIGLLVMIFSLMSGAINDQDLIYERTSSISVNQEAITLTTAGTTPTTVANLRSPICTFVAIYNGTTQLLGAGNVTEISECVFRNNSLYSTFRINYTYTYLADQYGTGGVINDTSAALSGVTDWFDIFIVITAMVVLIMLTVIIITAIRSSGMVAGSEQSGANQVGTA
jgi:uncharacterized membrane protein